MRYVSECVCVMRSNATEKRTERLPSSLVSYVEFWKKKNPNFLNNRSLVDNLTIFVHLGTKTIHSYFSNHAR